MNATIHATTAETRTGSLFAILGAAAIGLTLMVIAGHVQASTLHAAAHDTRHATGFPCH